jgi:tRNA pseudouridine65 synthase
MKHISHPIIGDARFGRGRHNRWFSENLEAGRLLLHAETLGFTHPQTAEKVDVLAPCSGRFMNAVNALSWNELFDEGETP